MMLPGIFFDYVEPNYLDAIRMCWSRLVARGCKRIGLVLEDNAAVCSPDSIEEGFDQVQRRDANPFGRVPVLHIPTEPPVDHLNFWLLHHKPDAIISGHSGLLPKLQALGVSIPENIAYVSINADEEPSGVAGLTHQSTALGAVAIEHLHRKLLANIHGNQTFTVGCRVTGCWQEGWSLRHAGHYHRPAANILSA